MGRFYDGKKNRWSSREHREAMKDAERDELTRARGQRDHREAGGLPKGFEDKPELSLCWQGLTISISAGYLTRRQAIGVLQQIDIEANREVGEVVAFPVPETPPDIVA